jgi:hypothetical protein
VPAWHDSCRQRCQAPHAPARDGADEIHEVTTLAVTRTLVRQPRWSSSPRTPLNWWRLSLTTCKCKGKTAERLPASILSRRKTCCCPARRLGHFRSGCPRRGAPTSARAPWHEMDQVMTELCNQSTSFLKRRRSSRRTCSRHRAMTAPLRVQAPGSPRRLWQRTRVSRAAGPRS